MLDINFIRKNPKNVTTLLNRRNTKINISDILKKDLKKRKLQLSVDKLRKQINEFSKEIASAKNNDRKDLIRNAKNISEKLKLKEQELNLLSKDFNKLLQVLPNLPKEDVPIGKTDSDNKIEKEVHEIPKFKFDIKDYIELSSIHNLIDIPRAAKVSGTRFGYIMNKLVFLEFALINYTFDCLKDENFIPIIPPDLIKEKSMGDMGYLTALEKDEIYYLPKDKLYLVGTSEQSIGPMHSNEIIDYKKLPLRYLAFSTCFRREAGSYGKDTKGILRSHQFDKIEMFSFAHPDKSENEHKFLLEQAEKLLEPLKIPYRVVKLCTGDMSHNKARTYDIECYIPSEKKYRETHSISTCTDYQARRLNIRVKDKDGKNRIVHTLNGTAFAIGRTLIAILENYQQADGSVKIPEVLIPYMPNIDSIK